MNKQRAQSVIPDIVLMIKAGRECNVHGFIQWLKFAWWFSVGWYEAGSPRDQENMRAFYKFVGFVLFVVVTSYLFPLIAKFTVWMGGL